MTDDLILDLATLAGDPLAFVHWAFPWKSYILPEAGPEPWQEEVLTTIRDHIRRGDKGAIRIATVSGNGVGKSALVAWLVIWSMTTAPDTLGVVTANTENQLKTKTWASLGKWYNLFLARELFALNATSFTSKDQSRERTWRCDMIPWSERNPTAFQGLHNKGKRLFLFMDEASGIEDVIWDAASGCFTDEDTEMLWLVFGNPNKPSGRFRDCFPGGKFAHRWTPIQVDSRTVSFTNKKEIQEWIEDYGEDSDFVRVRVKGEFPRIDGSSFIPYLMAQEAVNRLVEPQSGALIIGVDVGRFGDDPSVIYPRRGRDASSYPITIHHGLDTMALAAKVADAFMQLRADICMVDGGGVGAGVVDRLRQLRVPVIDVQFGAKPDQTNEINRMTKYANKRAEMWGAVRDWLPYGSIPQIAIPTLSGAATTLVDELTGPRYGLNNQEAIQLERKKDMRARGVPSPNLADALAITFAVPSFFTPGPQPVAEPIIEPPYDPFTYERIYL